MKRIPQTIIIVEVLLAALILFSIIALVVPGPMEQGAGSQFEYFTVIVKVVRFGLLSLVFAILLLFFDKLRRV